MNKDYINNILKEFSDITLKVDKRQMIRQLNAMSDSYIELWINSKNLSAIILKDRCNINRMTTKN